MTVWQEDDFRIVQASSQDGKSTELFLEWWDPWKYDEDGKMGSWVDITPKYALGTRIQAAFDTMMRSLAAGKVTMDGIKL